MRVKYWGIVCGVAAVVVFSWRQKDIDMIGLLNIIAPPVIGGVIGLITNDIAIKMLFRPQKPRYLFGKQLPLTPGMIPKNKARLASGIAHMVADKLMSADVLSGALLGDEMIGKIRGKVHGYIEERKTDERALREVLAEMLSEESVDATKEVILNDIEEKVREKMSEPELAGDITGKIMESLSNKGGLWSLGSLIATGTGLDKSIAELVGNMLKTEGAGMVVGMVGSEAERLLERPLCELLRDKEEMMERVEDAVVGAYRKVVEGKLPEILSTLDIASIVEQRIMDMDVAEMERMILDICHKELKVVVWIGGILGALIGCVNVFI